MWTKKDCRGEFGAFTGLKKVLFALPGQVDVDPLWASNFLFLLDQ